MGSGKQSRSKGACATHRSIGKRVLKTRRYKKDTDQILDEIKKGIELPAQKRPYEMVDELPGNGEFFCVECDRFFVNEFTLKEHKRSKQHKQRVKELKVAPYSHKEAEQAAGMGSYVKPEASCYGSNMDLDVDSTETGNTVANSVRDYEDLLADSFANYVSLSEKIGSVVQEQAALVLVAFKEKDPVQAEWAKAWIQFLTSLQIYVRKNHTTGLVWNAKGAPVVSSGGAVGAPPPPPPPAAGFFDDVSSTTSDSKNGDSRAALFASLNQGTDITKALKKVSSTQMTHKNPSLRQSSAVPEKASAGVNGTVTKAAPAKLPPKFELEGKKWLVENHQGNKSLTITDTNMSQSVNVYNCTDSLLIVKGKVNSITVNKCKKFSIVFDNIVAVVEFIDCQRAQAQVNGFVPTITADKVDGIEVFLSKESLSCEIVSSKSSEINISVPNASDEYVEHPIPEQFKSIWNGKGFTTVAVDKN
ncbi:F-actin-capping protein subunit alpha [Tyrophagus putrescentiae]|nr:F-actin-capping protein subunit alpha [Tyrophagus putrescentiae]